MKDLKRDKTKKPPSTLKQDSFSIDGSSYFEERKLQRHVSTFEVWAFCVGAGTTDNRSLRTSNRLLTETFHRCLSY
jgi:hypothetical protein